MMIVPKHLDSISSNRRGTWLRNKYQDTLFSSLFAHKTPTCELWCHLEHKSCFSPTQELGDTRMNILILICESFSYFFVSLYSKKITWVFMLEKSTKKEIYKCYLKISQLTHDMFMFLILLKVTPWGNQKTNLDYFNFQASSCRLSFHKAF